MLIPIILESTNPDLLRSYIAEQQANGYEINGPIQVCAVHNGLHYSQAMVREVK
jgi:hypothetical protein